MSMNGAPIIIVPTASAIAVQTISPRSKPFLLIRGNIEPVAPPLALVAARKLDNGPIPFEKRLGLALKLAVGEMDGP